MKGVHFEWNVAEVAVLQDLLILLYLQSLLLSNSDWMFSHSFSFLCVSGF